MDTVNYSVGSVLTRLGIIFCISQSAIFSGLNLAFFSISRLQLEIEQANGNSQAARVLALRKDANFILTTVLWGNVAWGQPAGRRFARWCCPMRSEALPRRRFALWISTPGMMYVILTNVIYHRRLADSRGHWVLVWVGLSQHRCVEAWVMAGRIPIRVAQ
jgi:hypothetical protein